MKSRKIKKKMQELQENQRKCHSKRLKMKTESSRSNSRSNLISTLAKEPRKLSFYKKIISKIYKKARQGKSKMKLSHYALKASNPRNLYTIRQVYRISVQRMRRSSSSVVVFVVVVDIVASLQMIARKNLRGSL
jgi:hypothetical protein